ncbi:hybrid sensor histidine kinase/response regulator [Desulfospira joergensenii]|uniref:hybrid sensor histidine kinase/response regulator n=1 Tax=Desulfospira joergensenii TaxID=53329 RepID=UPI0003B6A928|nr:response regulator [Desulfospira joergensenii]
MDKPDHSKTHRSARRKFLELSLESTRKSYYPQLLKQFESAKENEKRLQLLIDNLPAQISYVNADERYVFVNREFERSFGLKRHGIIGRRMKTILGEKNYDRVRPHIENALSGKSGRFEFSFLTSKKNKKWYEIHYVSETDTRGKVSGFYALTMDLTEKKQAEEEKSELKDRLRQAQKMEAIGTLSGGIAHDFNNILSGMFGYSQLIDSHVNEPEQVKAYNRKIFEGALRASSLIQQILSFSRQAKYSKQPLSLFVILKEVLKLIRPTLPSSIEIRDKIKTKATILADPTQIHQVVMNLCTNAYHAMGDEGGVLTLGLDEERLGENEIPMGSGLSPGRYLRLEVRDTGPGIPPRIREKIFDPYFTTKEVGKGTGLGLAVVDGIVKKHAGFINLDTELGSGTSFQIYLPVIETERTRTPGPGERKTSLKSATGNIMLVDDEHAILTTLKAILSRQGYQVSTFDNGESALESFTRDPARFDLIITDMTMPRMNGDKLSKKILEIRKDIPIIICTGYHGSFTKEEAVKAGIKRYLQKPVIGSELSKIIRELLSIG